MAYDQKTIDGVLYTLVKDDDSLTCGEYVWMPWDDDGERPHFEATPEDIARARKLRGE